MLLQNCDISLKLCESRLFWSFWTNLVYNCTIACLDAIFRFFWPTSRAQRPLNIGSDNLLGIVGHTAIRTFLWKPWISRRWWANPPRYLTWMALFGFFFNFIFTFSDPEDFRNNNTFRKLSAIKYHEMLEVSTKFDKVLKEIYLKLDQNQSKWFF